MYRAPLAIRVRRAETAVRSIPVARARRVRASTRDTE
jgi:hypothetical protein